MYAVVQVTAVNRLEDRITELATCISGASVRSITCVVVDVLHVLAGVQQVQ
jgi:hypothetical protein